MLACPELPRFIGLFLMWTSFTISSLGFAFICSYFCVQLLCAEKVLLIHRRLVVACFSYELRC